LAVDSDLGVCKVPTKILVVSDLTYSTSLVHVKNSSHDFDIDVATSKVNAVNGKYLEKENALWGSLTVWGKPEDVGNDGDGLNTNYDAKKFVASYACTDGLKQPISFECGDAVGPKLAQGAARLTIRNVGSMVQLINDDTRCGFSSAGVMANPTIAGTSGQDGSATWKIDDCELDFSNPAMPSVTTDGNQVSTTVRGKVRISATRTVHGTLTGDPGSPVVPGGPDGVEIVITKAEFDHFSVAVSNSDKALTMISGSISAKAKPRLAVSAELGVCKV